MPFINYVATNFHLNPPPPSVANRSYLLYPPLPRGMVFFSTGEYILTGAHKLPPVKIVRKSPLCALGRMCPKSRKTPCPPKQFPCGAVTRKEADREYVNSTRNHRSVVSGYTQLKFYVHQRRIPKIFLHCGALQKEPENRIYIIY